MFRTLFLGASLSLGLAATATAVPVVLMGSDYLETTAGTTFLGQPFKGVPVGPGNTDTIVRRLQDANLSGLGSSDTVPIELVALQLVSVNPIDLGPPGPSFYFVTLQSVRGGPQSLGRMTIRLDNADDQLPNTPEGTFDSFFDVFFDLRIDALDGPIVQSGQLPLTSANTPWDATPPPGAVIVPGPVGDGAANLHTNLQIGQLDFFPVGVISERHPDGAVHNAQVTTPEPASLLLLSLGLAGLAYSRRRHA